MTNAVNVQQKRSPVDPWPVLVRQMSSSKQKPAGSFQSTIPPPPSSSPLNNQALWLGVAAVLLGGGAYIAFNSKEEKPIELEDGFKPVQLKKRECCHLFYV